VPLPFRRLAVCAALALGWAISTPAAFADDTIVIGDVGAGNVTHWPIYIADAKGFFKDAGVKVDWVATPSSAAAMQQLAAGSVNMSSGGISDGLRAISQGAPVRMLRIEVGPSPYEIYSSPDVKTFTDLRKKTVMIGGIKDITRIYFEDMAKANGLKPGDYDYVFAGATGARFAALTSGSIAATILFPPFTFKAGTMGYNKLGSSADYTKNFPFTALVMNVGWARQNQRAIKEFQNGFAKGVDWFSDPANKAEAVDILVKASKVDPVDAANAYDFFRRVKAWDREGAIPGSGVENMMKILKDQGDLDGEIDIKRFYDASLVGH
jgi:ABC-type nitrate/sulfonate/bicarbonate transport system substrate-binding protein